MNIYIIKLTIYYLSDIVNISEDYISCLVKMYKAEV